MLKLVEIGSDKILIALQGAGGAIVSSTLKKTGSTAEEKSAMDAIESLVLAHAVAGVNVKSKKYIEGLRAGLNAFRYHFYFSLLGLSLAHAAAGVNVKSKKYIEGLRVAMDAIGNHV